MRLNWPAGAFAVVSVVSLAFASATLARGAEGVTTISTPEGGQPVVAKTDSAGTIHLLFDSKTGPRYAKSTDHGRTFSPAISVVDTEPRAPGLEFSAWDMVVGAGGRIHVAMATNAWQLKLPQEDWGFYYASLDPGGQAFSPTKNINRTSSEGFSLAADEQGNVAACWLKGKLYANISHDNGQTFSPTEEIDPALDPCDCCTTSSVYAADGRLAILYREETDNQRDMFLVLWDQNRHEATRTQVSSTLWKIDACPMSYFTINRDPQGFVAVWPTEGKVYFARLDGQGALQLPLEIKTPGTTGTRTGMLALPTSDGKTLVVWKKNGQLNWQFYDPQGQPAGLPDSTKSAGSGVAGVRANNGEFVLFQ